MSQNNKLNFTKSAIESLFVPASGKRAYYYDSKIRGLGISVTGSGTKSFIVYRWFNGKPERITLGRYPDLSIEQARKKAAEINGVIAKGENPNDKRRAERAEVTLEGLFNEYMNRYAKLHKPGSWSEDLAQYNRYLTPWKQRKLSTIEKIEIQKLHQTIGSEKGKYTANRLMALLSVVFNKAIEWDLYEKANPVQGIKKFREASRERFLQSHELPRFFKALSEETNESIRDYVLLSLLTGARRGNVLSMRWEDINFENGEWYIQRTKNGTSQIVTLVREAVSILEARKTKLHHKNSPYVFASTNSKGYIVEPKSGWKRILARADIKDLRLHDLRRTLGSWQARAGASLTIIGKSLNHKSPISTSVYARLDLDPVRSSVEKAVGAILEAGKIESI